MLDVAKSSEGNYGERPFLSTSWDLEAVASFDRGGEGYDKQHGDKKGYEPQSSLSSSSSGPIRFPQSQSSASQNLPLAVALPLIDRNAARSLTVWRHPEREENQALREECNRAWHEAFHDAARRGLIGWEQNKISKDARETVRRLQVERLRAKAKAEIEAEAGNQFVGGQPTSQPSIGASPSDAANPIVQC